MKLKALIAALAVAAVLPAAAFADEVSPSDKANGARACQALKTSLGEATFKTTYGTNADKSNAFGKCVSKWTQAEHGNRHEAVAACKAEQADANFAREVLSQVDEFADSLELEQICLHGSGELHYRSAKFFPGWTITVYFEEDGSFGDVEAYEV